MLKALMERIRARIDLFVRTHIVAEEKDLWPELDAFEQYKLDTAET